MKLLELFRKSSKIGCEWEKSCNCKEPKSVDCDGCKWYQGIDSGYGYCKALPQHIIVAWCRDICSLFTKKEVQ